MAAALVACGDGMHHAWCAAGVGAAGWSALFWAAQGNHPTVVHALLEHGADPEIEERAGEFKVTALLPYVSTASFPVLIDNSSSCKCLEHRAGFRVRSFDDVQF